MGLFIIHFLITLCFFQVQGDSIANFEASVNEASKKFTKYDDEFFGSIVLSLSKLREITSEIMFRGWNSTCTLKNVLSRNIKGTEQKECVELNKSQWTEKLQEFNSEIYRCLFDYREMGEPIRQKFHNAKKEAFEIQQELSEVKKNCSNSEFEKSESQCISDRVQNLKISFENLLKDVTLYNAEADTFQPKVYLQSLICNAKLLDNIYDLSNQFKEKFKNCV
ncbi:uncharacterized protein LOC122500922 isoform X1 [Leptopilina heterotoma]|uniref:uncharacterized protein LOC122500922 isoform X1 n=1 Tax=Leptopilina heterotoma TaxID=63436 RepID=UPI001CA86DD5|nr:uncharacterized protein LOC122500922 isoform X1 [Leptopilina heterotoma]